MKSLSIKTFNYCLFIHFILGAILLSPALSQAKQKHANQYAHTEITMPNNTRSKISNMAKSDNLKWLCYYGSNQEVLALPGYNLLVLEGDALGSIPQEKRDGDIHVAYMSIGEISPDRWYWPKVQNKPWLLEKNRDWAGSVRVDPRSPEWKNMLINTIAPALFAKGYDGLMLDNVDIGEYLEEKDPKTYSGAKDAVVDIIRDLRKAYPHAALITNGGLDTAVEAADSLDAAIRESVFSRWITKSDGSISYEDVSPQGRAWLRPRLLRIRSAGLPLLDLEYVAPEDETTRKRVWYEAKKAGYFPYIAQRNLMHLPGPQKPSSAK